MNFWKTVTINSPQKVRKERNNTMADTVQKQSQELATQLWAIANELRGNMDASKFKNYILGVIFYRYLSEKTF